MVLWTHKKQPPNSTLIGSAVLAPLTHVPNRHTDHTTCDSCSNINSMHVTQSNNNPIYGAVITVRQCESWAHSLPDWTPLPTVKRRQPTWDVFITQPERWSFYLLMEGGRL